MNERIDMFASRAKGQKNAPERGSARTPLSGSAIGVIADVGLSAGKRDIVVSQDDA
jgi:hypothetical protein